ncbi:MAG: hypothetical protein ABH851_02435, partial [Methanobacteriota archaeon]
MMVADMMAEPERYKVGGEDYEGELERIAKKSVGMFMKTSTPYMESVMTSGPKSWGEAVKNITEEKIDVYGRICGLLREKQLTAEDVASSLGEGVDASDISPKARHEYSEGIELPDKIDESFINYLVALDLAALDLADIPVESYSLNFGPKEESVLNQWRRREILADINQRYLEREKEEAVLQEEDSWNLAYITAEAMIEKIQTGGGNPPQLDALAEMIYENKAENKKIVSRGESGFKTN